MKLVTLTRADDKGDVSVNPESVSDVRNGPDGKVVVRLNNGTSYKVEATSITDVTALLVGPVSG